MEIYTNIQWNLLRGQVGRSLHCAILIALILDFSTIVRIISTGQPSWIGSSTKTASSKMSFAPHVIEYNIILITKGATHYQCL